MANRNNSGRTKKTHGYRPYDSSNSFVKRITDKVSEIIPQSTSWVSKWFSPAPKLNVREREEIEDEEDDEDERQPPSKRLCFSTSETSGFSHQNNLNRLSDLGGESGELSPIAPSRTEEDAAIPGPSGLHLRHFVSSTPAVRQTSPAVKVNLREKGSRIVNQQGDDGSDESESTSGCSSLVPAAHPRQEPSTPNNLNPPHTTDSVRRLSMNTTKASGSLLNRSNTVNLSTSFQPSFDTYVFNNPLNRSGIRKRPLHDTSSFYDGNTTYGGASARLTPSVDSPRVVSVKASPTKQAEHDIISSSATRILRALEQFSTPVLDAKRIPLRRDGHSSGVKRRKPPQPYEELIFPSMPDLLRLKRQETERSRAQHQPSPSSSSLQPPSSSVASSSSSSSSVKPSFSTEVPLSGQTSSHQFSTQQYSLRVEDPKERHIGSIKGRSKDEDLESERVPSINLPEVKLQISSLPKFDLNVPASEQRPTQIQTNQPEQAKSKPPPFKFSEPEVPSVKTFKSGVVAPAVNTFKFSEPLEPLKESKTEPVPALSSIPPPQIQMKNPSPVLKLKRKTPTSNSESQSNLKCDSKSPFETKNASVMDVFKNSIEESKNLKKVGYASKESNLECSKCSKNSSSDTKCQCGTNKVEKSNTSTAFKSQGFEGFKKPKDTWECKECFVANKNTSDVCAACSTPKAGKPTTSNKTNDLSSTATNVFVAKVNDLGAKATPPLLNSIKVPEGSWECNVCLVRNKKANLKCVACSANQPGAAGSTESVKPTFTFGIPSSTASPQFKIGSSDTKLDSSNKTFSFGIPSSHSNGKTTQEKAEGVSSSVVSPVSSSVASPATSSSANIPLVNSIKKPEGSWECSVCLVQNKKESTSCAACSTAKPGSAPNPVTSSSSSTPLVNSFKKPEGSWECGACLVQNKKESQSCVACSTPRPGCAPQEKPKETFTFGIPGSSTPAPLPNNITFGSNTDVEKPNSSTVVQPKFTFGVNSMEDKTAPKTTLGFSFPSNDTKSNNDVNSSNFINSDQSKENESPKISQVFSFGSHLAKDNSKEDIKDNTDNKLVKKEVSFGNPISTEKVISNDTNSFGSSVGSKPNEISSSSNFTFTPKMPAFDSSSKKETPATNALFSFGGTGEGFKSNALVPTSFTAPIATENLNTSVELSNSKNVFGNSLGGFKPPETETKPFAFMANSQSTNKSGGFSFTPPTPAGDFNSQQRPTNAATSAPLFGGQQVEFGATPFNQEQKPFVFGSAAQPQQAQQPQPPLFTFNAPPNTQMGGLGSSSGTPAFGGFPSPAAPKFDPTIKPTFNFTGGSTPSFSAPTPGLVDIGGESKRKVRKAVRRTTQNR